MSPPLPGLPGPVPSGGAFRGLRSYAVMLDIAPNQKHCEFYLKGEKPVPSYISVGNVGSGSSSKVTDFMQKY